METRAGSAVGAAAYLENGVECYVLRRCADEARGVRARLGSKPPKRDARTVEDMTIQIKSLMENACAQELGPQGFDAAGGTGIYYNVGDRAPAALAGDALLSQLRAAETRAKACDALAAYVARVGRFVDECRRLARCNLQDKRYLARCLNRYKGVAARLARPLP